MKLEGKSNAELLKLAEAIESDPANQALPGGLFKLTPAALRKIHAITEWITHNLAESRKAVGRPVNCPGYSGRRQNPRP